MKKHVIFDFYGTLVKIHTDEALPSLWQTLSRQIPGYEPMALKEKYFRTVEAHLNKTAEASGCAYPEVRLEEVFAEIAGCSVSEGVRLARKFRKESMITLEPFSGTLDTMKRLREEGKTLYLLSNAQACFTMAEIHACGVDAYLDRIYISSDYRVKKPQKEFMEHLLSDNQLNVNDCLMVGNDVSSDLAIADACGMDSVYLNTDGETEAVIEERIRQAGLKRERIRLILSGRIEEL